MARKYAHRIPFIVKINHNELLTYPNRFDQVLFGTVEQAYDMGAAAVGATIYFGSDQSTRQIVEISQAFAKAHELGLVLDGTAIKSATDFANNLEEIEGAGRGLRNELGNGLIPAIKPLVGQLSTWISKNLAMRSKHG